MSSINAARSQRLAQPNTGSQTEFIAFGACLVSLRGVGVRIFFSRVIFFVASL